MTAADPKCWLQDHGDYLYRYALRQLRDSALAEDMVQETLLAAWQSVDGYAGQAAEKTWLTGILKHKIIDCLRKQLREAPVDDITALSDSAAESGIDQLFDARGHWITPPRNWGSPHKTLENHQFVEALQRCLERLKPTLARVFTLKEISGNSNEEICAELGISAGNCGVLLYRARMGLRRCLEVLWSPERCGDSN
ncbi:MAG: sigma-70 family RNA polymerase sigma factor [Gammaproteobacteria bacterium]